MTYNFTNDYSEGCHPVILKALIKSNLEQQNGYGEDFYTQKAISILQDKIENKNADIHLVAGGTQANLLVLSSFLKPYESVISSEAAHINTLETGAIEATGHKIDTVYSADGKLYPDKIIPVIQKSSSYHKAKPKFVYISNSTELGTIYNKDELKELYKFCQKNDLLLFLDGARLASALSAPSNNMDLKDIAEFTDIFYLGGTKCGALIGEAIIITNNNLKEGFKYNQKQKGALLAKGRLLGIQFCELLKNNLIFELANHSNLMASKIAKAITKLGYSFLSVSDTNQIFPIFPINIINSLKKEYGFSVWKNINPNLSAIRLITSWATPEKAVDQFIYDLNKLAEKQKELN